MSSSLEKISPHLKKYVAPQQYDKYTPEDQATWRYILRQLKDFLSHAAHPVYVEGLKKTGISIDRIPRISEMDELLQTFGWGAVPVSGFIPPAAFMEFQSLGILPIASDMRSLQHLLYTPAPDIVHEAAGHAPILIHPEYAEYLKSYAHVAKNSIISKEDLNQYEAIRKLSDLKESPGSTKEEIAQTEKSLEKINESMSHVSEASLLSRMNWWTAEYGLIGDLKDPKIYGAGLLSSLGESRECLKSHVQKIPLDVSCVDVSYDITEPQPQLFVTPNFAHLHDVLEDLAKKLAYRIGGVEGLKIAKKARSVNSVELDSGLQISGVLDTFIEDNGECTFVKFTGPSQLSVSDQELDGHGKDFHTHGYSSPLGPIRGFGKDLSLFSVSELEKIGCKAGQNVKIEFESGFELTGTFLSRREKNSRHLVLAFKDCTVRRGAEVFFQPEWGQFDLACGHKIVSVFGGPADRENYGELEDFVAERVASKPPSESQKKIYELYGKVRSLRDSAAPSQSAVQSLWENFKNSQGKTWLIGIEILELALKAGDQKLADLISAELLKNFTDHTEDLKDGIRLAKDL